MPLYEYECNSCGNKFEKTLPVALYQSTQHCMCGSDARKLLSAPSVFVPQNICYDSPIDGRPITSQRERDEDLKRADCVPWEPGIKQDGERRKKEADDALDAAVDSSVDKFIDSLPAHKRVELANELSSGAEATFIRQ